MGHPQRKQRLQGCLLVSVFSIEEPLIYVKDMQMRGIISVIYCLCLAAAVRSQASDPLPWEP